MVVPAVMVAMSGADCFPIVGVGASAGGIEALEGLFRGLPSQVDFALVIITHLSPDRASLLHEIIARYTKIPVEVASDGAQVRAGHVYVLPEDAVLGIEHRRLHLHRSPGRRERKPVDVFFSALAIDIGEFAAGVVLSGGDGDGTLGIKAIKERGGLTLAQVHDGFGPRHASMPESAIASGLVDLAIPVEEMGVHLVEFARTCAALDHGDPDSAPESGVAGGASPEAAAQAAGDQLAQIYTILRTQIGHDFSGYKSKTFMRRVQRRMQVTLMKTMDGYLEKLRQDPAEVGALFRDLLINVTNFFRDEEAFAALAAQVIPKLFARRGADDTVRIWIPGCATGEEVYSIAILVREHMETLTAVPRVQIFATDIDERALAVARAARYPAALLDSVTPERRRRFFISDGGSYTVSKDVRELCIFSPHSVIRDPPFSRMDLISCRNLLIYFGLDVQGQVIPIFHYALRPDGYLFLGSAENVSQFEYLFLSVDKKHRIFRRRADVVPSMRLPIMLSSLRSGQVGELVPRRPPLGGAALRHAVDEQVLERFAPPHVVINHDGDVVYFSARTGKYLETPAGAPTRQLLTMARRGLRLDLRAALREAVETGRAAGRDGVAMEWEDGRVQIVDLMVEPLGEHGGREPLAEQGRKERLDTPANEPNSQIGGERGNSDPLFLVLFTDRGPALSQAEAIARVHTTADGASLHMERELRETRERLQSMIEEYETALEELKSSNEELVSVNEEMQSTNEELEASKEELQSLNEELHTVNAELSGKIEALDRANNDLLNLFQSTDVATIFLDKSLAIRSFTPAVGKIFRILPSDTGRPITDLSSRLLLSGFAEDIALVLNGHAPIERRAENAAHDEHYLLRLAPYCNYGERIEGVVVTFIDVTNLTHSQIQQSLLIAELQHRTRNLLAVVQSIAQQTLGKGGGLQAFIDRLSALSRVQNLVGGTLADQIDLRDILRLELLALGAPETKVRIDGPPVALDFDPVQTLALALHELATNAVKHGALKHEQGQIDITWSVREDVADKQLVLDWRESGVADLMPPERKGFGRDLIEKALGYTLRAKAELQFKPGGLLCHIELPLARSGAARTGAARGEAAHPEAANDAASSGG